MSLVTVKPKFQVTIPAKLRERIDLHEGDLMEASIVKGGILLRLKDVVDRNVIADRIETVLQGIQPSLEDERRSEDEIMQDTISDISEARKQRHKPKA